MPISSEKEAMEASENQPQSDPIYYMNEDCMDRSNITIQECIVPYESDESDLVGSENNI